MMRDLVVNNTEHVMCVLLLVARLADVASTYFATPSLRLECNPLARRFGWWFITLSVLACAIPYWSVNVGMVVLVMSLWVSADNVARVWFIRSLGEAEYHAMVQRAIRRGTIGGRVTVSVVKAGCIGTMGIILACLTYTTPQPPLSFWFAVGILGYGFLNLFTGVLHLYRMTRGPRATAEQSHPEATSESAPSADSEASDARRSA